MRRVKALMIARHILAWLWLLVWLTASPSASARVANSGEVAPTLAATDGQGNPQCADLAGLHFQALRASRRVDFQSVTDPLAEICCLDAGVSQRADVCGLCSCSEVSVSLASSWQFLLRTALSPRAPSFVS